MSKQINPNLLAACAAYNSGKRGIVQLGSSRSGKTVSDIDFFIWLTSKKVTGKTIFIVRETYASFKTTLYEDFNWRLPMYGIASPFAAVQERPSFKLFGNKFFLLGADNASKFMGSGCDFLWFNEGMHVPEAIFHQLEMRCREFFIIDSNPEFDDHYIFNKVITRPDVALIKTTYKDNPFCPPHQRAKIESYEPWLPGSYEVSGGVVLYKDEPVTDMHQPPSHPVNIAQGTADEYMWRIFGLGEKAEKKGRIYKRLYRYTDLPQGSTFLGYGGDLGFSPDPTVIVAIWRRENDLFIKEVIHATELDDFQLSERMKAAGIRTYEDYDPSDIVLDSAGASTIAYLRNQAKFRVHKAKKPPGSVQGNIRTLSSYKLHIHVDSAKVYNDFENYCWKWNEVTDQSSGEPERTYKHSPDATAYLVVKALGWRDTTAYE